MFRTLREKTSSGYRKLWNTVVPPQFTDDGCTGVPDLGLKLCCRIHDFNYSEHSKVSRLEADIRFRKCIQKRNKGFFMRKLRYAQSWVWYWAVRKFGKDHYEGSGDST